MKFQPAGPERFAHQKRGLKRLIETRGVGALLFDPGTGKTATTLDYLSILALKAEEKEARVLVVAPLAAVDTWVIQAREYVSPQVDYWAEALGGSILQRAEALAARGGQPFRGTVPKDAKHHPRALHYRSSYIWEARAEGRVTKPSATEGPGGVGFEQTGRPRLVIEVVNFDTFSRRTRHGSGTIADRLIEAIKRFDPDCVVVDESHKIKSASSNVSRFMARVADIAPRRILLTGTVMPVGPLDVFGQWRFLAPYDFGDEMPDGSARRATLASFKNKYAVEGGFMGREVIGYKNLDHMQSIMAKRAVVARKEDALDLPSTTEVVVPVNLSVAEEKAYLGMKRDLSAKFQGNELIAQNVLTQMLRLRQITSGHLPDDHGQVHELGTSKVQTITSLVQDSLAGEKRIVIFCLFSKEIEMLHRSLSVERGTEVMRIEGATPGERRLALRQRFGSDDPQRMVLIAQIKTLSLAVNELVTANHAIFGSLSQQRDDLVQARDRLNRIGQKRPVTFWYALAPRTIDEVIFKSHQDRTDLESAVLNHILDTNGET